VLLLNTLEKSTSPEKPPKTIYNNCIILI
jgi:hypothetical protein